MIGTSTQPGAFTEEIVKEMAAHTPRPIIMPLSNQQNWQKPKAKDVIEWTDGKALVGNRYPCC